MEARVVIKVENLVKRYRTGPFAENRRKVVAVGIQIKVVPTCLVVDIYVVSIIRSSRRIQTSECI